MLKLVTLCETGSRASLGGTFGPVMPVETSYAAHLLPLLDAGMLLLSDRGFDSDEFLANSAATGAQLLVRVKGHRTPAKWAHLPDGSYLTRIRGVRLRIIDAEVTARTNTGIRTPPSSERV